MAEAEVHYAVAIVGGGPIGLTLANLLGAYGIGVLLVERNLTTVQEPRAVSIDDESLRTLQAAGVVDDVLGSIVPGYGSTYYSPGRRPFAKVEPKGRPYGYARRNAFRQPILEAQLRTALSRFPEVETRFGWRLDTYTQAADRVRLDLVAHDGAPRRVFCDFLVGCDGAASRVRDLQGVQLEGTTFDERWLIIDLEDNENTTKHTEVFCDPRRPCITLPGPDRTRRFEFKLLARETDEDLLAPAMVQRLLRDHGADPEARLRRKVVYRFHARVAPRWSFGRVFLAGDAAHLTPPFAGQGMNSGIRDAQNLAWKLAAVLKDGAAPALLDTYEEERKDHIWQMVRLALRMGSVMSPRSWSHGFATRLGFRALNLWPPARDYVGEMRYKPPPRFNTGFLVPDERGRKASLIGRLLPQPPIRFPDGRDGLLDDLLGTGFSLLLRSVDPASDLAGIEHPLWDRLKARRAVLLADGTPVPSAANASFAYETSETDDASFDTAMRPYEGCALLVRPDHYVAAAIPLDRPERALLAIEALLGDGWSDEEPSRFPSDRQAA